MTRPADTFRVHLPQPEEKMVFDKFHVSTHLNEAVDKVRRMEHKERRARALKEQAMKLWDFIYPQAARNHFAWWCRWATHCRLKPMIEKAKMLNPRRADN